MSTKAAAYASLSKSLQDEVIKSSEPSSERAIDILTLLQQEYNNNNKNNSNKVTISILESTNIGKILTKTVTVCKRQKRPSRESTNSRSTRRSRRSSSLTNDDDWDKALSTAEELLSKFKNNVMVEKKKKKDEDEEETKKQKYVDDDDDDELMTNDNDGIDNDDCADLSKNTTVTFSDNGSTVNEDTISSPDNNIMNIDTNNNINNNTYSEETLPKPLYSVSHRVYAKDDATGLLYPAFVRKVMWGPKSNQVNMGFCSSLVDGDAIGGILDDNEMMVQSQQQSTAAATGGENENEEKDDDDEEEEEDEDTRRWGTKRNCFHYYVHYMGWAVKWDRWVEERYLKEASESTELLSKVLMKEYNKVKPKKKGQKMTVSQMNKWMKRMNELEAEHKMMDKDGKLSGEDEKNGDIKMSEQEYTNGNEEDTDETMNEHFKATVEAESEMKQEAVEEETAKEVEQQLPKQTKQQLNIEHLQKQAQLRGNGLQMKRKKSVSDQLTLPFNLKKILVEEWEVITQCNMVHNLPSKTSIREALDQYLESKLGPLRKKHEEEMNNDKTKMDDGDDKMQIDDVPCNKSGKQTKLGKEWIEMVEGIALFFDQALPVHLLFEEERGQHNSLRRQILAQRRNSAASAASSTDGGSDTATAMVTSDGETKSEEEKSSPAPNKTCNDTTTTSPDAATSPLDNSRAESPPTNFLPERMSEIYGCEHLLRLFTRLPSVVTESTVDSQRRIFSKLGDLVRYLQKNQAVFHGSYRKPLPGEIRRSASSSVKKAAAARK